ncbi:RPEL repeat protein [Rutstroemia sp. NJR-2017a BVV2]|nr:RPEL repeat protein [Rutstroemia sp. NJR-2017a BVV2]
MNLEKLLTDRPTTKELKDRHILLDTDAAPLKKGLEKRPTKEDLVERNILPSTSAAPGIQAQQKELQKHMRADSLNEKISHRPKPEELVKQGVLHEDPTSPTADPEKVYEEAIEEEYAKREGGA